MLNCKILHITFVYLRIPVGVNPRIEDTWNPIFRNLKKKLLGWNHKVLFLAGKACLINSVLSSLGMFYLFSKLMVKKIVKILRNFVGT